MGNLRLNIFSVTRVTLDALRFIDSPFFELSKTFREIAGVDSVSRPERWPIIREESLAKIMVREDELFLSIFCFVTSPNRLRELLDLSRGQFECVARRELLERVPQEAWDELVGIIFVHWGNFVGRDLSQEVAA